MTKIYLQESVVEGQARVDLIGENLPENFLGLATDLKVSGGSKGFSLEKVELGAAFKDLPEQFKPILLYKAEQEEAKVVFGLALKANNLAEVKDGVLASFYLADGIGAGDFVFDKQVLSVFEDGGRKDLNDVLWVNSAATIEQGNVSNEVVSAVNIESNKEELENWSVEGIIGMVEEKSPLNWLWKGENELKEGGGMIWWGIGFGLLVLVIGLGVVFRKRWVPLIKWPKKANLALEKA